MPDQSASSSPPATPTSRRLPVHLSNAESVDHGQCLRPGLARCRKYGVRALYQLAVLADRPMIAASFALRWDEFEREGLPLLGVAHSTGSDRSSSAGEDVQHSGDHAKRSDTDQPHDDVQPHATLVDRPRGLNVFMSVKPICHEVTSGPAWGRARLLCARHEDGMTLAAHQPDQ